MNENIVLINGKVEDRQNKYLVVSQPIGKGKYKYLAVVMNSLYTRTLKIGDAVENLPCTEEDKQIHTGIRSMRHLYTPVRQGGKAELVSYDTLRAKAKAMVRKKYDEYRIAEQLPPQKLIDRMRALNDTEYLDLADRWKNNYYACKRAGRPFPKPEKIRNEEQPLSPCTCLIKYNHIYVSKEEGEGLKKKNTFIGSVIERDGKKYLISYGKLMDSPTIGAPETELFEGEYYNLFCHTEKGTQKRLARTRADRLAKSKGKKTRKTKTGTK